jgi:hypothetical protein
MANDNYLSCGGNTSTFPPLTIYDSLRLHSKSFKWYINRTLINRTAGAAGSLAGPCASEEEGDSYFPDLCLDGVSRYKENFTSYAEFFRDARDGTLPHLSMILPNSSYGDHPCNDVRKGELTQQ